jgi:hypothetical protein
MTATKHRDTDVGHLQRNRRPYRLERRRTALQIDGHDTCDERVINHTVSEGSRGDSQKEGRVDERPPRSDETAWKTIPLAVAERANWDTLNAVRTSRMS